MAGVRAKFVLGGALMVASLAYLGFAAMDSGWVYVRTVDELAAGADAGRRTRVQGKVGANADIRPLSMQARFQLAGEQSTLIVEYRGAVPARLATGSHVIAEGRTLDDGVFHADVLLTKCTSKYEECRKDAP